MILVSAGDALTAKLIKEVGFDGIWVSGFEASARLGLPDNGSITLTEMLNITKPIVEAGGLPVYVDCDTGYGCLNRTVKEFERIGVAGICVEDVDPEYKQNSLWGDKVPLMDMDKFSKKLDIKRKIDLIARTESFVRGYGEEECWKRLKLYSKYADYLLPHSRTEPLNVKGMKGKWAIVPTKFPHMHNKELKKMGYDMVIWANQTERVKIKAIREALKIMKRCDCALPVEGELSASLDDMKGLVDE